MNLNATSSVQLHSPRHWLIKLGWAAFAFLSVALFLLGLPARHAELGTVCAGQLCAEGQLADTQVASLHDIGLSLSAYATYMVTLESIVWLVFAGVGSILVWRKSDESPVGVALFVSIFLFGFGLTVGETMEALNAVTPLSRLRLDALEGLWGWLPLTLFLFLFPNGRFVPRWIRLLAGAWVIWRVLILLFPSSLINPDYAWPDGLVLLTYGGLMWLPGVAAQVYRYVAVSRPEERQQTKWVVWGVATAFALLVVTEGLVPWVAPADGRSGLLVTPIAEAGSALGIILIPTTIGLSVLRYRLWDVDPLINRTLVYGLMTVLVVGIYAGIVAGIGAAVRSRGHFWISLIGAGVVAVLFQPVREWVQRGVNRLMYGQRDEPYTVLANLGKQLEEQGAIDTVLHTTVETVAQSLRLPYAAIAIRDGDTYSRAAEHGSAPAATETFPITYQAGVVGRLVVAPRSPDEALTSADRRLLRDIARHAGPIVHSVQLTRALQRSRERLVTALEEERRRLRRDLHDGLGPALASQGLKLAALQHRLERNPAAASDVLEDIMAENSEMVANIRRLVYALRPPALDELGLIGAVRDYVGGMQNEATAHLKITVRAPQEGVPPVPAAVEVAAYRIVSEAVTNVVHHAQATECIIRCAIRPVDGKNVLEVSIADDGIGIPNAARTGVGLTSMRERAEEIGGTCVITGAPAGGTRVVAELPIGA